MKRQTKHAALLESMRVELRKVLDAGPFDAKRATELARRAHACFSVLVPFLREKRRYRRRGRYIPGGEYEFTCYPSPIMGGTGMRDTPGKLLPAGKAPLAIGDALRAECVTALAVQPITPNEIELISLIAESGARLLFSLADDPSVGEFLDTGASSYSYMGTLSANPVNTETFAAKTIRELTAALPKLLSKPPSTLDMVYAIAEARRNGMTDVAAELEMKLTGKTLDGDRPVVPERPPAPELEPPSMDSTRSTATAAALVAGVTMAAVNGVAIS